MACVCIFKKKGGKDSISLTGIKGQKSGFWSILAKNKTKRKEERKKSEMQDEAEDCQHAT